MSVSRDAQTPVKGLQRMRQGKMAATGRLNMLWLLGTLALCGCSAHTQSNLRALLEHEKSSIRESFAMHIGASPTEVSNAFDSSLAKEMQLADQVTKRLVYQKGLSKDEDMQAYLQSMVMKLTHSLNDMGYAYKVYLLADDRVNAFTPGGGTILIKEGLLSYCETEAQMAAVLSHEIAHIVMRHPNRLRKLEIAKKTGGSVMSAITPEGLKNNLGKFLRLGGRATVSSMVRAQEAEADSVGIDIMVAAGYDPHGMAEIQRQLRHFAPKVSKAAHAVYGNHPLSEDREKAALEKISQKYPHVKGIRNTKAYAHHTAKYQQESMDLLASKL
jgi:predicted Zn-dependent protease